METGAIDPEKLELVGLAEISGVLGVPSTTVASWRQRGLLPKPRWQLMAGPVWAAAEICEWYERERGGPGATVVPDRSREAIDLSAEPHRAEVFAHYGLAMGEAQMVEQHLAAVIALLHPPPATQQMFFEIVEKAERKTLGALKDELRTYGVPVIGLDLLQRVVATRNVLAHGFFRDPQRSVKMTTDSGRGELIAELDRAAHDFWTTAQYLRAAEVRLAIHRGASKSGVMERLRRIKAGEEPRTAIGRRSQVLVTESPDVEGTVERAFDDADRVPDIVLPTNSGEDRPAGRRTRGKSKP